MLIQPQDVAQFCYTVQKSFRVFTLLLPELLSNASLWWLIHLIPERKLSKRIQFNTQIFDGFASISSAVPETYTLPISGQLVIITQLVKEYGTGCNCCCKNQLCQNNQITVD